MPLFYGRNPLGFDLLQFCRLALHLKGRKAQLQVIGALSLGFEGALVALDRLNSQWRVIGFGQLFSEIVNVLG